MPRTKTTKTRKQNDLYGQGCAQGKQAALYVLARYPNGCAGGSWQNIAIDALIDPDDIRLRGWLVGYLYALECAMRGEAL